MASFFVYPYGPSAGARDLAAGLGAVVSRRERPGDAIVINWGAGDCPYPNALNCDNRAVLNKIDFFERLSETGTTPRSTTRRSVATQFGFPVFCRTRVEGRDGEGIVIAENASGLVDARLYVEAVTNRGEYRVHVGRLPNSEHLADGGQGIIGTLQKFRARGSTGDSRIMTGDDTKLVWTVGGQQVEDICPPEVKEVTLRAFTEFPELTFAAFDVVYDGQNAYVLEANSAPLMTPKTVEKYVAFFNHYAELVSEPRAEGGCGVRLPASEPLDPEHSSVDELLERWREDLNTLVSNATPIIREPSNEEVSEFIDTMFGGGGPSLKEVVKVYLTQRG